MSVVYLVVLLVDLKVVCLVVVMVLKTVDSLVVWLDEMLV